MNLVTGATGIVGSHVVLALLQNNEEVIACKQKSSDVKKVEELFSFYTVDYKNLFGKIKWVDVDILDIFSIEEALKGVTNVYHCAGFVSFDSRDRKKTMSINETGTKNVVDACLHNKIKALCHVSSLAAIHNLDYTSALSEDVFWKKSGKESDYAISKYNAEREVWRGIEEGLNAVIVNPGVVLSPGFVGQSSSRLFDAAYKGNKFYPVGTTAYIAASDVAKIMIKLIALEKFGQRYILIENNYRYFDILSHIQRNFNKPVPSIKATRFILTLANIFEDFRVFFQGGEKRVTKALIRSAFNKQEYSNKKINTELGVEFVPVLQIIEQICQKYGPRKNKGETSR
ncbi:NAD-dependent epimerase/dehydratase family protein [Aurantibacillus circumpalustris]|uniref:NAD-dependent epimerase/dehydratase family protein n=1 Tax=Aurantibacillus circumpalustris TaxID=3036359 RepID=UPI00295B2D8B|nr:NAD-dependent epimerase/dehydratase family protein [Aurantibacillus circumpalustris]